MTTFSDKWRFDEFYLYYHDYPTPYSVGDEVTSPVTDDVGRVVEFIGVGGVAEIGTVSGIRELVRVTVRHEYMVSRVSLEERER